MGEPLFKQLNKEEFLRMNTQERLDYLTRLMSDLREKMEDTKRQIERAKQALMDSGD